MNSFFNSQRNHFLLQQRQLKHHRADVAAHAREAAQEAQADHAAQAHNQAHSLAQGRYGDTVFRTVPWPAALPPRQNRLPGQRGDARPARAGEQAEAGPEETESAEAKERREASAEGGRVEAVDRDAGHGRHASHSHDREEAGRYDGLTAPGGDTGRGQSGGGDHGGAGGGGSGSGHSGGGQREGRSPRSALAGLASRSGAAASLPGALSAGASQAVLAEVSAFRATMAREDLPAQRARQLAAAMVEVNKPGTGQWHTDAMTMSLMAAYLEASHEPGALSTLARVKQVLVELEPVVAGALAPSPQDRNRLALLPLKLLVSDRRRTEAQRQLAVERLRAGQQWPTDVIEIKA